MPTGAERGVKLGEKVSPKFSPNGGEEGLLALLSIPLSVLTESADSGYLRYLILTMFLLSLPEM
jgi:hypothetical protein